MDEQQRLKSYTRYALYTYIHIGAINCKYLYNNRLIIYKISSLFGRHDDYKVLDANKIIYACVIFFNV